MIIVIYLFLISQNRKLIDFAQFAKGYDSRILPA